MAANFKSINPVPLYTSLIDTVLSTTQRKTPTVIHPQFPIQKIRAFYMKKIKYTAEEFQTRLQTILTQFPRLEDAHPFYADLINILYDKDHYKMALGHVNVVNKVIQNVSKEFLKLLKFGDSLYRCKQLKKSALGRMASSTKKLKGTLEYLEEVRQHMSRLPTIDLSAPTLLICGYPNVGKSSLINKVSRAKVEVQPYAFTTKNLYVGHFELSGVKYQVIDTPGVLDHKLEDRNTIEMQSIIALAHIKSVALFLMDVSENCGFSVQDQASLFESLKPLIGNVLIVLSKADLKKIGDLDAERAQVIHEFLKDKRWIEISVRDEYNICEMKELACSLMEYDTKTEPAVFAPRIVRPKDKQASRPAATENRHPNRAGAMGDRMIVPEIYNGKNIADMMDVELPRELALSREYDVLSKEMMQVKEDVDNAMKAGITRHMSRKRMSVPEQWKERAERSEFVPEVRMEEKQERPKYVKRKPKIINKMPKHLYRGKSKHGGK